MQESSLLILAVLLVFWDWRAQVDTVMQTNMETAKAQPEMALVFSQINYLPILHFTSLSAHLQVKLAQLLRK